MKILQIIPADGWVAQFEGAGNERLVCWALVEDDDGSRTIEGMIAGSEKHPFTCSDAGNFDQYRHVA